MLKKQVYLGSINIVENERIRLYQSTSPLLSLGNGKYVNLEWIVSLKDYLKFYRALIIGNYSDDIILSDKISGDGVYIDKESLIPYYDEDQDKHISISKVIQDFILDPRVPRGIDQLGNGEAIVYVHKPDPKKIVNIK